MPSDNTTDSPEVTTSFTPFPATKAQRPPMTVTFAEDEPEPTKAPVRRPTAPPARPSVQPPAPVEKSIAETNPDFLSIELPSKFLFYTFSSLAVGNIRGKHQAKFAAADKHESTRMMVEAISALLPKEISAAHLTIPDFYFVMYHLRLNSTGMVPMVVRAVCSDPEHVLGVAEGKLDRNTLITEAHVTKSTLSDTYLEPAVIDEFMSSHDLSEFADQGLALDAPRMADTIELEEKWYGKPEYDEMEFLAELAGSICRMPGTDKPALTFDERIEIVGNMPLSMLSVLKEWQNVVQSYGVEEYVSTTCRKCGAKIETEVSISASSFL